MITEQEATTIFEQLRTLLERNGLEWIVLQVLEEIGRGKPEQVRTKQKKRTSEIPRPVGDESHEVGNKISLRTIEFTQKERLRLLIDAVKRAAVDPCRMEAQLTERFGSIRFLPEQAEDRPSREFHVTREGSKSAQAGAEKLDQLLNELKDEVA